MEERPNPIIVGFAHGNVPNERVNEEYFCVVSCGICQKHTDFHRPNGSREYMLNLVMRGALSFNTDNANPADTTRSTNESDNLTLYRPHEPQHLTNTSKNLIRYYAHFAGFGVEEILHACHLDGHRFYTVCDPHSLEPLFLKLLRETLSNSDYKAIKCTSYLLDLLTEIARQNDQFGDSKSNERILPALEIIQKEYHKELHLDNLAELCSLSKYHFSRLFKKYTNFSPNAYLTHVRILNAKEWLKATDLSIGAIAEAVGFKDPLYFSKVFRIHVGKSPSEYRHE